MAVTFANSKLRLGIRLIYRTISYCTLHSQTDGLTDNSHRALFCSVGSIRLCQVQQESVGVDLVECQFSGLQDHSDHLAEVSP